MTVNEIMRAVIVLPGLLFPIYGPPLLFPFSQINIEIDA